MKELVVLLCVLGLVSPAPHSDEEFNKIINQIFGSRDNSTEEPANGNGAAKMAVEACKNFKGEEGICTHYTLCENYKSEAVDGTGILEPRFSDSSCSESMNVCCVPPQEEQGSERTNQNAGCGWRNPNGIGQRVAEDIEGQAKFGEFPWTVAVLMVEQDEDDPDGEGLSVFICGGSLIHPSVVLTAAHSLSTASLIARAGEWDTQSASEAHPTQDRVVSSVKLHEDFDNINLFNDIALLFLSSPINLAPNVGLVCLPPPRRRVPSGTECFASGWGKDRFGDAGAYHVILKRMELPVVGRRQCQKELRRTRLGHFFQLHSTFMCAVGEDGKDTCTGDGGSPLVCPIEGTKNRYMQSGIVAWAIGCGENGTPGVYADVSQLRDWVDDKVTQMGLDPSVYTP